MFNCGLVLIYEVLRDRLPDTDELEESLGFPVLASIPTLRLKQLSALREDAAAFDRETTLVGQTGPSSDRPQSNSPT
jgi:hypothetical protein